MTPRRRDQPSIAAIERAGGRRRGGGDRSACAARPAGGGAGRARWRASWSSTATASRCSATRRPRGSGMPGTPTRSRSAPSPRCSNRPVAGETCERELQLFGPPRAVLQPAGAPARRTTACRSVRRSFVARRLRDPSGRQRAARLRRQREPRAQDADRRARAAGGDAGVGDRPGGHPPAGRADGEGGRAARPHRRRPARPQPHRDPGSHRRASRCRVDALVDEAVDRMRPAAAAAGIELAGAPTRPATRCVACDRRQVVSAIANLLDNAVKYSEPGRSVDGRADGRRRPMS